MTARYNVTVTPGAEEDVKSLPTKKLIGEAMRLILSLREDPYQGEVLRSRPNLKVLAGCRRLKFDDPTRLKSGRIGRPKYRIVYRNEPEGAPAEVSVLAVAHRKDLLAYRLAAARLRSRLSDYL